MDLTIGNYATANEFFDLNDYIYHSSNSVADLYMQEFRLQKAEMRQDRSDAVVSYSTDWLAEYEFTIQGDAGKPYIPIDFPVMSFPYDNQNSGFQNLFINLGTCEIEAERSNISERWQAKFLPTTDRIFFVVVPNKIEFINPSGAYLKGRKGTLLYVPGVGSDMLVPDGIANQVINMTVQKMKVLLQGVVVDNSANTNPNKVLQTEIDPNTLKPV